VLQIDNTKKRIAASRISTMIDPHVSPHPRLSLKTSLIAEPEGTKKFEIVASEPNCGKNWVGAARSLW
jgi:hypothetical protein